jgi:hypothetical protein
LHAIGDITAASCRHLGYDSAVVIRLVIIVTWTSAVVVSLAAIIGL